MAGAIGKTYPHLIKKGLNMKLDKNEVFAVLAYTYDMYGFESQYFLGLASTRSAAMRLALDEAEKSSSLIFSPPDIVWCYRSRDLLAKGKNYHIHISRTTVETEGSEDTP